jgi:hypothetical protein
MLGVIIMAFITHNVINYVLGITGEEII